MTPTPAATPRYTELDGLRALSVIAVFLFHSVPLATALFSRGWDPHLDVAGVTLSPPATVAELVFHLNLGVQVFFVLSGFLITRVFVAPYLAGEGGPALATYGLRRAARIFPAYWLLLVVASATWFGIETLDFPTSFGAWKHASLTYLYFREPGIVPNYGGLAVSWSLVAELTFYVFVPLWFVALTTLRASPGLHPQGAVERFQSALLAAALCVPVGVASVLVFAYGGRWAARTPLSGLVTVFGAGLCSLGLGMVLAVVVAGRTVRPRLDARLGALGTHPGRWWALAALVYVMLAWPRFLYLGATEGQQVWQRLVQPVIALLLVAPMVLAPGASTRLHGFLRSRPLVFVGTVSYGIYLWHTVVIARLNERWPLDERGAWAALAVVATMFVATLLAATASWFAVERPLLALAHRVGRRPAPSRGPTLAAS